MSCSYLFASLSESLSAWWNALNWDIQIFYAVGGIAFVVVVIQALLSLAGAGDADFPGDITPDGDVYVGKTPDTMEPVDEPYLTEKAFGECNIELPYQVPESRVFVMGDHRSISVDSRNTTVGCVAEEQLVGKLVFRVWPLPTLGKID